MKGKDQVSKVAFIQYINVFYLVWADITFEYTHRKSSLFMSVFIQQLGHQTERTNRTTHQIFSCFQKTKKKNTLLLMFMRNRQYTKQVKLDALFIFLQHIFVMMTFSSTILFSRRFYPKQSTTQARS